MKRSPLIGVLVSLLIVSVLIGLSDTDISVADTSIPNNEVASSIGNSSASA